MIKDLLLDILDILFPLLLYQLVCITNYNFYKKDLRRQMLLGLCCGAAIVLSMLLPTNITNDFNSDLRTIPLIIAVLYGSNVGGTISFVLFFMCRYLIGLDNILVAFMTSLLICAAAYPFAAHFNKKSPQFRFIISILLTITAFIVLWGGFILTNQMPESYSKFLILQVFILQLVTMCMAVLLMEVTIKAICMQEQIIRTEKLNVTSQLAASVAHEIRSPLTSIKGFLQLSLRNAEGKNKKYLEISMMELGRMEYIINNFLNYAKPQMESIGVFPVSEILFQIKDEMEPIARVNHVDLQMLAEEDLWIQADLSKIKQALTHIIRNSIDATSASKGQVSITAYRQYNQICIQIRDNGVGMSAEQLSILGAPFYSTKMNGTGLGLMVTFRIIQSIGGRVEFKSVKGEGTTALVTLPTAPDLQLKA
ncbi:HAMP domain-containing histidine kinase [Paenibacillus motobuensis]|uniref:sensor histidine kinase n=1 Tax=Paenibacillus TaxID=44249 RepID=UPI00203E27DE|nr:MULTISPECIES: HAMP domain-containing sensor histidine kinase [Paenibacillus]MCM3039444.1 HAMP domain-containing histidine kinase [Paenibacillus lutimineralis]MCM3646548.1 HAMP domain-containing histidine kinase [Paenibacillus motobuensis]